MLKAVVLIFFIVASIDCGVVRRRDIEDGVLNEIIKRLEKLTKQIEPHSLNRDDLTIGFFALKTDCKDPMPLVEDISTDNPTVPEVFCKATKAIESFTPCQAKKKNLEHLKVLLWNAAGKETKCTIGNSQVNLKDFLEKLLEFSRKLVRQ